MQDLSVTRAELDKIDKEIINLYKRRLKCVEQVAEYKLNTGKPVLDPEREKQKLDVLASMGDSEFDDEAIRQMFTQIMSISRKRQYQIIKSNELESNDYGEQIDKLDFTNSKVVFQGVEGAYSQAAMKQFFGKDVDGYAVPTWKDACEALKNKDANYAVLPLENSSQGIVAENHDLLAEYGLFIVGEQVISIDHALLGIKGSKLEDIVTVYSHPQALMQCNGYISKHGLEPKALKNTALGAKFIKENGDKACAAIAGEINAELYDLEILDRKIQDIKDNMTRFVIVSAKKEYEKDANKVTCFFEIPHSKGSLYNSLSHLIFNNINLCRIESRPSANGEWEYRFFVDFMGNLSDLNVKMALYGLKRETAKLEILGNYVSV